MCKDDVNVPYLIPTLITNNKHVIETKSVTVGAAFIQ